jgi:hypothetical protein
MKIHDFGLWFNDLLCGQWSKTIPQGGRYYIFYDGYKLGYQSGDSIYVYDRFRLEIYTEDVRPFLIKVKEGLPSALHDWNHSYIPIGRLLTLDDFTIEPNPDYNK